MRMMNEFEAQVLSDLSVLKTQMTNLTGDGNGGRHRRSGAAHGPARAELAARQGISGGGQRALRGDRSGYGGAAPALNLLP